MVRLCHEIGERRPASREQIIRDLYGAPTATSISGTPTDAATLAPPLAPVVVEPAPLVTSEPIEPAPLIRGLIPRCRSPMLRPGCAYPSRPSAGTPRHRRADCAGRERASLWRR
ncbi:hypothetical protein FRAAL4306 [Frankia alni ACN14a]|uniref:Uncharacterized protein n=1 Tax=Frankia alni (strain DSM 45986 / CECT 9034 / ACN14a) TaxID=326424 RepID=Q0RHS5_FRAAA|nr:hypothetical protein FRAAL4306 [Frankia alni ACN14a]